MCGKPRKYFFKDYKFFSSLEEGSVYDDLFNRGICLPSDAKMDTTCINEIIKIIETLFTNKK